MAGLIGFILVALFMVLWYRLAGVVASVALVIYVLLTLLVIPAIYSLWKQRELRALTANGAVVPVGAETG